MQLIPRTNIGIFWCAALDGTDDQANRILSAVFDSVSKRNYGAEQSGNRQNTSCVFAGKAREDMGRIPRPTAAWPHQQKTLRAGHHGKRGKQITKTHYENKLGKRIRTGRGVTQRNTTGHGGKGAALAERREWRSTCWAAEHRPCNAAGDAKQSMCGKGGPGKCAARCGAP